MAEWHTDCNSVARSRGYWVCRAVRAHTGDGTGAAAMDVTADGGQAEEEVESDLEGMFDSDSDEETEQRAGVEDTSCCSVQ